MLRCRHGQDVVERRGGHALPLRIPQPVTPRIRRENGAVKRFINSKKASALFQEHFGPEASAITASRAAAKSQDAPNEAGARATRQWQRIATDGGADDLSVLSSRDGRCLRSVLLSLGLHALPAALEVLKSVSQAG
jgi:hypothetical protein